MTTQHDNWFELALPDRGTHRLGIASAEIWLEQYVYDATPMVEDVETIELALSVITDSITRPDPAEPEFTEEIAAHLSTEDLSIPLNTLRSNGADCLDGVQVTAPEEGEDDLEFADSHGFLATPILGELKSLSLSLTYLGGIRYRVTGKGRNDGGEEFSMALDAPCRGVLLKREESVDRVTVESYLANVFDAPSMRTTWKEPGFRWVWTLEARFTEAGQASHQ